MFAQVLFVSNPVRFRSPTYLPVPLHSVSSEERLQRARKLTLVVDLDKTVLHSSFDPFALAAYDVWRRDGTNIPLYRVPCDVWSLVSGLRSTVCGVDIILCVACVVLCCVVSCVCFVLFCF
jgi:CO dehydrogenase/acetyl-CoA synthase delta subunit